MPIVPGNEPTPQRRRSGGFGLGWIVWLAILGPTLYRLARNAVGGRLTDQQFLIIAGGLAGLFIMILIVRWVNNTRTGGSTSLPTGYQPPRQMQGRLPTPPQPRPASLPEAPRFEPMVTGKVVLAGLILAAFMGGAAFILLSL